MTSYDPLWPVIVSYDQVRISMNSYYHWNWDKMTLILINCDKIERDWEKLKYNEMILLLPCQSDRINEFVVGDDGGYYNTFLTADRWKVKFTF